MIRTTSNRIISVLLVFCMVLSFAAYSEEAFDMKLLIDNVLTIHSRPVKIKENEWDLTSLFKGTLAEKKGDREQMQTANRGDDEAHCRDFRCRRSQAVA